MEKLDEFLRQLIEIRARGRMTEGESRQMHPERETRPDRETSRDYYQRIQNVNSERAHDWSGSSFGGQAMSGRSWGGGRER